MGVALGERSSVCYAAPFQGSTLGYTRVRVFIRIKVKVGVSVKGIVRVRIDLAQSRTCIILSHLCLCFMSVHLGVGHTHTLMGHDSSILHTHASAS